MLCFSIQSQAPVKLKQHNRLQDPRETMDNQKIFSAVFFAFAMVTLLSCFSPVSCLNVIPRVTRTSDAVILDFADDENIPISYQNKDVYGAVANPGFIPFPAFNPFAMMMYQQQRHPMFYSGWPYFFGQSSLQNPAQPAVVPAHRQYDDEDEEYFYQKPVVKQQKPVQIAPASTTIKTPVPTPAPGVCGRGPGAFPSFPAPGRVSVISERIAGGVKAKRNAWPFMVALKNMKGEFFCGGALISDIKVLLAAQCLEQMSMYDISGVTVLAGMHATDPNDVQMTRRVAKVVLHSKYNSFTFANDIAMITLDSPVVFSKTVGTVCLPDQSADPDYFSDQDAIILGWGMGGSAGSSGSSGSAGSSNPEGRAISKFLQQGKVTIVANADCKSDPNIGRYVTETNICMISDNQFTCTDDVGGPIVANTADTTAGTPAVWTLVGINSYTKDCASNSLKTRVSAYRDWIELYMK